MPSQMTVRELFQSVDLVPHADIHWYPIPQRFVRLAAVGYILKRRKKRFDIIVATDGRWQRAIDRLGWWHGACVIPETDEARLHDQWRHASRSLL
jgi:hypothetical protein